jgi:pilus assembly protein CpaE
VRLVMSFNEMEGIADKVKILVNRVGLDTGHITLKKAEETIGKEIFWQLPNDYRTMIEARNNGVPLIDQAPKSAINQAISQLANALSSDGKIEATDIAVKKTGLSGLFKLWPLKK